MIFSIENGQLTTDLDCQFFNLLNVNALVPVPAGLVGSNDPRLSDQRVPLDGSVTDVKVAAGAAIVQSKLLLNGVIPPAWLGTTATTAAQGNLAEYLSHKAQPNGYPSLDGTGKIPVAQLPALAGVGTVTSVGLSIQYLTIAGSPVTTSGTLAATWASAPALSWFGNPTTSAGGPAFRVGPIPVSLIPALDASQITTGVFTPPRLPVALYGGGHALGAVPDPGGAVPGNELMYLARDMSYRSTPTSAKVTVLTTVAGSATFFPDTGMRVMFVELWAGGGGGGGATAPSGLAAASGGAGGGYCSVWITDMASSYNYAIGGGGTGGNATGTNGSAGNPSHITWTGGTPTATGGNGGTGDSTGGTALGVVRQGGSGGAGGGDLGMGGSDGGDSIRWDATHGRSGDGGGAGSGGGGSKGRFSDGSGTAGNLYGGGGAGAISSTTAGYVGGAGAGGAMRVTQYF